MRGLAVRAAAATARASVLATRRPATAVTQRYLAVGAGVGGGDLHTMKVPKMGDSITEGTIVEWTKSA